MTHNADPSEVAKFDDIAARWWDPHSEFRPLHDINPLRLDYIDERCGLVGKQALDVGCGGGLLTEGMARRGAQVMGIDMAGAALEVARLHLQESGLVVDYRRSSAEALAEQRSAAFDVVACMELLEHVPDPASLVAACARLVKPGGDVFFSTINRTAQSYLMAIVGAEYVLNLLPKGTHDYARFIRPSELDRWMRAAGLVCRAIRGVIYNPLTRTCTLNERCEVNYIVHAQRAE